MARKILKEVMFEEDEFEVCVTCGELTTVKKTDNVVFRSGYVEGAGQLCFKCSQTKKMHKTGNYGDNEWQRYA